MYDLVIYIVRSDLCAPLLWSIRPSPTMYGWLKDEDPDSDDRCVNTG